MQTHRYRPGRQRPGQHCCRAAGPGQQHRQGHRRPDRRGQRGRHRPRQRPPGGHDQPGSVHRRRGRRHQGRHALPRVRRHVRGLYRLSPAAGHRQRAGRPRHDRKPVATIVTQTVVVPGRPRLPESHQARGRLLRQGDRRPHRRRKGLYHGGGRRPRLSPGGPLPQAL